MASSVSHMRNVLIRPVNWMRVSTSRLPSAMPIASDHKVLSRFISPPASMHASQRVQLPASRYTEDIEQQKWLPCLLRATYSAPLLPGHISFALYLIIHPMNMHYQDQRHDRQHGYLVL